MSIAEALMELLDVVKAAIKNGDWKVDGACDPDLAIRCAEQALENHYKNLLEIYNVK